MRVNARSDLDQYDSGANCELNMFGANSHSANSISGAEAPRIHK